jgi:hypothetical protein
MARGAFLPYWTDMAGHYDMFFVHMYRTYSFQEIPETCKELKDY